MTWKLGNTSRRYEVGRNGGPGTISSGRGDYGGKSYRHLSNVKQSRRGAEVH